MKDTAAIQAKVGVFRLFRLFGSVRPVRLIAIVVFVLGFWTLILRMRGWEIQVVSVPVAQQTTGVVLELRNIFGDHVEGAEVLIGDRYKMVTDEFGVASMSGLPIGSVEVTVSAEGYRTVKQVIHLGPGKNEVVFRNDSGLVPDGFAVDFHVFWSTASGGLARGIAEIAIYNGSSRPVYVTECDILHAEQASTLRLLGSEEAFSNFAASPSSVVIVSQPEMAVSIDAEQIVYANPVVLPWTPRDGDVLSLRVVSTNDLAIAPDKRNVRILSDEMDYDADWDPHVP